MDLYQIVAIVGVVSFVAGFYVSLRSWNKEDAT